MNDGLLIAGVVVAMGFFLDLLIGDPQWLPHPVVIIGKMITGLEKYLRRPYYHARKEKLYGVFLVVIVVGLMYVLTWEIVRFFAWLHPIAGYVISVFLISQSFAAKGLAVAGNEVELSLAAGNIPDARKKVSMIVGRDTDNLDEQEISRAAVETIAENLSDGVIAPLFYAFLGGAPLALAYKAVNTLDSMVGYKNEQYLHFGWAAARFDDIVNYIPARLSAIFLLAAGLCSGKNVMRAISIWKRDARLHPSPNGGAPESVMAGLLGVRLGGMNYYGGEESFRGYLGDPLKQLNADSLSFSIRLMLGASSIAMLFGFSIMLICAALL